MNSVEQSILIGPELVKKLPAFYGTRRFITPFTIALHQPLFRDRSNQSTCPIQCHQPLSRDRSNQSTCPIQCHQPLSRGRSNQSTCPIQCHQPLSRDRSNQSTCPIQCHQPLSRDRSNQSTCPIQHFKIHFNIIPPYTPKYNLPNTIRVIISVRKSVWKPATTEQMICPYGIWTRQPEGKTTLRRYEQTET